MTPDILDRLLTTLAVKLHAFSVCHIQRGWRLTFAPFDAIVIHYVLAGSGAVRVSGGEWLPFRERSIVIVPARLSHALGEAQAPAGEARGEDHCTLLDDGLVKFTGGDGSPDTLLACGSITASYAGALGLFDFLREPMIEDMSASNALRQAFEVMLAEVAEPGLGTGAMTEALMKQCLIVLLRQHLMRDGEASPLFAALHDQRLAHAVAAVLDDPAAAHTLETLARRAGMSRTAFAERFSQVFGQGPIDFVQKVRLRIAAKLLATTNLPVKVISTSIGYASRSYFSRAFRAAYGTDPTGFRAAGGGRDDRLESDTGASAPLGPDRRPDVEAP
jgi:AraC-like DNA-binding protein